MTQKGLTLRDIEMNSDAKITDGYVADILRGTAANPQPEDQGPGVGLGVDAHALLRSYVGL